MSDWHPDLDPEVCRIVERHMEAEREKEAQRIERAEEQRQWREAQRKADDLIVRKAKRIVRRHRQIHETYRRMMTRVDEERVTRLILESELKKLHDRVR